MNKWISFLKKLKAPQLPVGLLLSLSFLTGCATAPQQNPYMLPGAGLGAALGAGLGIASSPNNPLEGCSHWRNTGHCVRRCGRSDVRAFG